MPTLREFVSNPDGSYKRGACARVADHLGVSRQTVNQWLAKLTVPDEEHLQKIQKMIAGGLDLSARRPPGRPRR